MNKKQKENLKEVAKSVWGVIVLFAYIKFYLLCIVGVLLSFICSIYILNEAGHDITQLAKSAKWIGYFGVGYIAIIMADKLKDVLPLRKQE